MTSFKSSLELQTKKSSSRDFAGSVPDAISNASEARYWSEKFGLGSIQGKKPTFAHSRNATLQAGSAAMVQDIVWDTVGGQSMAVVCGPRVLLYGTTPQSSLQRTLAKHTINSTQTSAVTPDRQVPTGGHLALTASFRSDGRLLAVGTDRGCVRIADVSSRATLCTFAPTNVLGIRSIQWFRNGKHLMAAGDDGVLRVWELAQGGLTGTKPICSLRGHGDAIRSAVLWQKANDEGKKTLQTLKWPHQSLAATGSYDMTVRVWCMDDVEEENKNLLERCLSVLSHDGPVEALLFLTSTNAKVPVWLLSAGGTYVKVWNPLTGACVATVHAQHRKTITSLLAMPRLNAELGTTTMRVLTGSVDGLLRIHSWDSCSGSLTLLYGMKLNDIAITSLACNPAADRLAIGTASGTVLVRQSGPNIAQHKRQREPRAGTFAFFTRGMNADSSAADFVVSTEVKKRKLKNYDTSIKQFRYGDALDEALESRMPLAVVTALEELGRRRGLTIALSNRDEESLEPILSFTVRYITRPNFSSLLIGVAEKLIDVYAGVTGQSERIDELFDKLKIQVEHELRVQKKLLRIVGQLEATMVILGDET
ncbi:hypothetical protein MPSEU_000371100 [Mayamaea pseudoterrestris]|nr:hypothetical protein MPSEU_000371100 [Mayamaea pseudoterrestris]